MDDPFAEAKRFEADDRFDLAEQQYQKAIELQIGDQAAAYEGRGRALARLGRLEEAKEMCQKALSLNPMLQMAHSVLGHVYLSQEKYDLAEDELTASLQIRPNDIVSLTNLGTGWFTFPLK